VAGYDASTLQPELNIHVSKAQFLLGAWPLTHPCDGKSRNHLLVPGVCVCVFVFVQVRVYGRLTYKWLHIFFSLWIYIFNNFKYLVSFHVRLTLPMVVKMSKMVWVVMPCGLLGGGTHCIHLQGWRLPPPTAMKMETVYGTHISVHMASQPRRPLWTLHFSAWHWHWHCHHMLYSHILSSNPRFSRSSYLFPIQTIKIYN
jgi:hypothetical protein